MKFRDRASLITTQFADLSDFLKIISYVYFGIKNIENFSK
jgi:hypothetical protein